MAESNYYLGKSPVNHKPGQITGEYTLLNGEVFYKIENYDHMRPFFMTIVSSSDHWLFLASNGGLTAGRKNSDSALFPYYTDDKLIDSAENTGSKTILHVHRDNKIYIWEPFSDRNYGLYSRIRNSYKNRAGNKVVFEEINEDLSLTFSYQWSFSDQFGFVKKSCISNISEQEVFVDVLDGMQNLLPYGVQNDLQTGRSTLVDAYKKAELDPDSGIGIFSLSAMIVDKAEPSEALKATTVWTAGIHVERYLLSAVQLSNYRIGKAVHNETDVRAERGAYFINASFDLAAKSTKEWVLVAEVNQDAAEIMALKKTMHETEHLTALIDAEIATNTASLVKKIALADGLQRTNDLMSTGRHLSNVLYNIMRGGIFEDQYRIDRADLRSYLKRINSKVAKASEAFLDALPADLTYQEALREVVKQDNVDLERLFYEYLPLSFSRRHGDPSRPWNRFSIETRDEKGRKIKYYEGNWRDIFQNWEALAMSFPKYLEGMINKFVNASTIDGYNPYRITRNGIDWEIIEPDDPWSFIGYWGDHQVIYLLKLLELSQKYNPGNLEQLYFKPVNVYANVPYRIKSYQDIVANPSDSIDFDHALEALIEEKERVLGSDGKLVYLSTGALLRANLTEKLLVMLLAKLYNFIPGAGIWLNTQRPEWNDANNALVGNGASMVTLYYLRRFLTFYCNQLKSMEGKKVELNRPVAELLSTIAEILKSNLSLLHNGINPKDRKAIADAMGTVGEKYRNQAYTGFDGTTERISMKDILEFCALGLEYIDDTIKANRRADGLYHAYNLITFNTNGISVDNLYEMLEGQVAVLSSGYLTAVQSLQVLNNLKQSNLFREDQYSYLLYPDRQLPVFMKRNNVPTSFIRHSALAEALLQRGDTTIFKEDCNRNFHFNANFHNNVDLKKALNTLKEDGELAHLVDAEYEAYLAQFEQVFNHKAFTGRSGTFYGYEGLGSIYWHMVSKLLLATQETIVAAIDKGEPEGVVGQLVEHYYEIRAGIGINKSPELYGAFPTDAYSHTPGNAGVQQPGMTGQVKEDIISRWAELGVVIRNGCIGFAPGFLNSHEYLTKEADFEYIDVRMDAKQIAVPQDGLAFTFCQVPIIYQKAASTNMLVRFADGTSTTVKDNFLPLDLSQKLFNRSGKIAVIEVAIKQ